LTNLFVYFFVIFLVGLIGIVLGMKKINPRINFDSFSFIEFNYFLFWDIKYRNLFLWLSIQNSCTIGEDLLQILSMNCSVEKNDEINVRQILITKSFLNVFNTLLKSFKRVFNFSILQTIFRNYVGFGLYEILYMETLELYLASNRITEKNFQNKTL